MVAGGGTALARGQKYDVILFGATGFTGRLVAEYLVRTVGIGRDVRWAIAGRTREKLDRVRADLRRLSAAQADVEVLSADSDDPASLRALARATRVVCTTVGPYARYGTPLVDACVAEGTDYCDITGEVQWIREMADKHHARAERDGTRIVCSCGYDSVPSDLGVRLVQEEALRRFGRPASRVECVIFGRAPNLSGGTFASMMAIFEQASADPRIAAILEDPFSLCPDPTVPTGSRWEQAGPRYARGFGVFTSPFVLSMGNTRVVHRSNALLGFRYGRDFVYDESMSVGRGLTGAVGATAAAAAMAAGQRAMKLSSVRSLAGRFVPQPGEGPSHEARTGSYFSLRFEGTVPGAGVVRAEVAAQGDPGYGETSKMVGESALCLARDGDVGGLRGGILTPASALGLRLSDRLRSAGWTVRAD
jgi:short subunit dehydrogenase-like uncharacterized protein